MSNAVTVQAVQFLDELVTISYAEEREQGKRVGHGHTIYIQMDVVAEEVQEILEMLRDVIDKGLLDVRNPDPTLRSDPRGSQPEVHASE